MEALQLVEKLGALIKDVNSVTCFIGRWRIISFRLHKLSSELAFHHSSFLQHPHSSDLLHSILSSIHEAFILLHQCKERNLIGKLQMQSNLDVLASKFSQHVQDYELLFRSHSSTIQKMKTGVSKEVLRLTIKDLILRLEMGDVESKKKALDSLLQLMNEDDKNVKFTIRSQGGIPPLVHMLDFMVSSIREKAASAVCSLIAATDFEYQNVEGAIGPLVRLLVSGSSFAKEKAATALQVLTYVPENTHVVAAHGGVNALVKICQFGTPGAQAAAAGCLQNLATAAEIRRHIAEEGAIPVLVKLVRSGTLSAQESAAAALHNISANDNKMAKNIAKVGGIEPLMRHLDVATSPKSQEIAISVLRNIAMCGSSSKALISAGFLPRLVNILQNGASSSQQLAASTICRLATCTDVRRALSAAAVEQRKKHSEEGVTVALMQLLDCKSPSLKQMSISTLLTLVGNAKSKKMITIGNLSDVEFPGAKKPKILQRLQAFLKPRIHV